VQSQSLQEEEKLGGAVLEIMDEDEEMTDEQMQQPGIAALKYGEVKLATADARAAGVAAGNIQVLGTEAETLQLPEVLLLLSN
jgi:hypothetical protein